MSRKQKNKERVKSHRRSSFAEVTAFAKDQGYIQIDNGCIQLTELGRQMLSLLPPTPPDLLKGWRSRQGVLRTTGRAIVTAEDLGILLMEFRFFSHNMNQDGSLPTERFRTLWEAMLEKGDIDEGWDYKRHASDEELPFVPGVAGMGG